MSEIHRALNAPRKLLSPCRALVESRVQKAPGVSLIDLQVASLFEAYMAGGLVASQGVGTGKTLVALLLAAMLGLTCPLILVKKSLVRNLEREHEKWEPFFHIVPYKIFTYGLLQTPQHALTLDGLDVGLIVSDEAHKLKRVAAGSTKRVISKVVNHRVPFVALTGTLTTESVADYAHLSAMALGANSPIPDFDDPACLAWRRVLGHRPDPEDFDWPYIKPLCQKYTKPVSIEGGRAALQEHLSTTAGFVLTTETLCRSSLVMTRITEPEIPPDLQEVIDALVDEQVSPDGDPLTIYEADIIARQIQYGFWYKRTTKSPLDIVDEWRRAANLWGMAVRTWLNEGGQTGIDTPELTRRAAREGILGQFAFSALDRFERVNPLVKWDREVKWVWRGWIDAQVRWLKTRTEPSIGWFRHRAIGDEIRAQAPEIPIYDRDPHLPLDDAGDPLAHTCAMAMGTMSEGHNLQAWTHQRVMQTPAGAGVWQQLLARTHRLGQTADEVFCEVNCHSPMVRKTLDNALRAAEYVEATIRERQRLKLATWTD